MTNLHDILEKLQAAQQRLPPSDAAVLFAAAVRLAAAQGATIRARLLTIDDSGVLHLGQFDDQGPETEPGYLAPELNGKDAPRKSEPRVQVYAAGALGFELLTGHRAPGNPAELSGPLGDIVRMALSPDRRERFGDLTQLYDAVEGVQPKPPAEGERNIFNALRTRFSRVAPEKEALARLIEKVGAVEAQIAHLAKAQSRLDAAQRQISEQLDRFQDGQERIAAPRRTSSGFGAAVIAAILTAAAVIAAGWALGMITPPGRTPQTAAPVPPPPPVEEKKPPPVEEKKAAVPVEIDAGAVAAVDAGAPDASVAQAAPVDAGTVAAAPAPVPEKKPKRVTEVSQAQLLHAVAISQVRRGESALEKGRADEALESFRAALENEATLAVAFRGMGMAYAMQGDDTQALQAYQRYLQLAPSAPDRSDIRRSINELRTRAKQ